MKFYVKKLGIRFISVKIGRFYGYFRYLCVQKKKVGSGMKKG